MSWKALFAPPHSGADFLYLCNEYFDDMKI